MNPLVEFSKNYIFLTSFAAWAIAQTIKVVLGIFREKRFNFRWFVGTGGMPSAHAASVTALSTSVGITYGFDSALFAIALTFTIIIMFDAQTTRLSSGKQAEILNKMLDDIYWKHKLDEEKLKEFLGHTPIQVFVGAGLGIVVSLLLYK
ncbi:MAG: divergent PAP2 family protein [Candidatus Omnitrophica bacterium]|nr:divergent PAP2 family protein [Candidatus Omnitrophota bacterium]MBU1038410.1 divergent PAP2 family protein [Candidatus Omnitrophota bacterium]MBU1808775.1 divergent PAP2 family protein [Candidatus Omnitrophota bacterium]